MNTTPSRIPLIRTGPLIAPRADEASARAPPPAPRPGPPAAPEPLCIRLREPDPEGRSRGLQLWGPSGLRARVELVDRAAGVEPERAPVVWLLVWLDIVSGFDDRLAV